MAVKVPPLLHKMSMSAQKAWYKKHGMEMPGSAEGKSAAKAKMDVGEINKKKAREAAIAQAAASKKNKELVSSSERVRKMAANAQAFGGSRPGGDLTTNRGIVQYVRAGGTLRAGRLGEENIQEGNPANKAKKKEFVRQLGLKAMRAGKVDPARGYVPQRAGREELKKEETQMSESAKSEAEKVLGGPVKSSAERKKMPAGKQPEPYRYVRALARKAMKSGIKKRDDESERMIRRAMEKEMTRMGEGFDPDPKDIAAYLVSRHGKGKVTMDHVKGYERRRDSQSGIDKEEVMKHVKKMSEEIEESTMKYIEEKLTAADPASKWISDFVKSDNPKFAGKSKKERINQALGAYYAAKRGKNEAFEIEESKKMEKMEDEAEEMEDEDDGDEDEEKSMNERYMGFSKLKASIAAKGGARDPAAVAAAIGRKKYGKKKFQAAAAAGKKMGEEVEQVDEQSPAEIKAKYYHDQFNKVKPVKAYDKDGKLVGHYRSMAHAKQMKPGHTYKEVKEEVESIDEANMRFDYEAAARPKSSDVKNFLNRDKNPRAAAASKKYIRRMTKLGGLGPNQTKKDTEAHMKAQFEGVEQVEEGFDPDPSDIAAQLVKKHGKGKVTKDHIDAYERDRDSNRAIDKEAVMKHVKKMAEGLDPVGREDKDVDNDGDSDKTDLYLSKRRKAISSAIRKKVSDKMGK